MNTAWIKNLSSKLSPERKDVLLGLALLLVVAGLYYAQWGYYLTSLTDSKINVDFPQKYFWWADDSRDYRMTGDWMFGNSTQTVIDARPWVYPLFVGASRTLFGKNAERVLWNSQFLMWLISGALVYLALYKATRQVFPGLLGAMLFYSHPSPLILTYHGLTETLNILLLCLFCWLLARKSSLPILLLVFVFSLLTATKPTYQIQLALLVIYALWQALRLTGKPRLRQIGLIALALIPIWIQFTFSFAYNRTLSISNIGPQTFRNYLVAVVYSRVENLDWRPSMQAIDGWDTGQELIYLLAHQRETLLTYRQNLIDNNQWVGSFFIQGQGNRMIGFVETANAAAVYLHLLMLPLVLYYLFSSKYTRSKTIIALIYGVFIIQTLVSGISTGQEDRLTVTGIPLWIIVYLLVLWNLFSQSKTGYSSELVSENLAHIVEE